MRLMLAILSAMMLLQFTEVSIAETEGERVARESMIKAQAEKARNDAIVNRQRAAEAAAKKAREDTQRLQEACRRARTC